MAVVVQNPQRPAKRASVHIERRYLQITVYFLGIDERIRSLDETHKRILIATLESSIMEVSRPDVNMHRVPLCQIF